MLLYASSDAFIWIFAQSQTAYISGSNPRQGRLFNTLYLNGLLSIAKPARKRAKKPTEAPQGKIAYTQSGYEVEPKTEATLMAAIKQLLRD